MIDYKKELEDGYTPVLAMEEASRCLLCIDPPCSAHCPAGTDPGKFIRSLRFKNLKGAIKTIRTNNILGSTCSRVCATEKYCQLHCKRKEIDTAIDIGKIQKFLTDYEEKTNFKSLYAVPLDKEKVAIIGSGPSGLAAAAALAQKGYKVTIFEKDADFGGWLRYGIPPFRLPDEVLDCEIQRVKDLGVEFKANCCFGKDVCYDSLKGEGYKAILIATGYDKGKMLDSYKNLKNAESAVSFLAKLKSDPKNTKIHNNYVIIGGGDVAMDVATSVKIKGAKHVKVVAIEDFSCLPASKVELQHARDLNISIIDGFTPVECTETHVQFANKATGDTISLTAERIILAIGQESSLDKKSIEGKSDVFVAGDLGTGDKTVVWAVKDGKETAKKIIAYLGGK